MQEAQQKKAKVGAFTVVDNATRFWLNNFAQEILPITNTKGQRKHFEEKEMALQLISSSREKSMVVGNSMYTSQ